MINNQSSADLWGDEATSEWWKTWRKSPVVSVLTRGQETFVLAWSKWKDKKQENKSLLFGAVMLPCAWLFFFLKFSSSILYFHDNFGGVQLQSPQGALCYFTLQNRLLLYWAEMAWCTYKFYRSSQLPLQEGEGNLNTWCSYPIVKKLKKNNIFFSFIFFFFKCSFSSGRKLEAIWTGFKCDVFLWF